MTGIGKCCQYKPKKGKSGSRCNKPPLGESDYCTVHQPLSGERSQCEHCHHLILRRNLLRHQKKCSAPSLKIALLPYYEKNCNVMFKDDIVGLDGSLDVDVRRSDIVDESELESRIKDLYEQYCPQFLDDTFLEDEFRLDALPVEDDVKVKPPSLKHRDQEAGIVREMKAHGVLDDIPAIYVEFGAGKGSLSKAIGDDPASSVKKSKFVCIERSSYKHKAENNEKMCACRARIDLSDVNLYKLIQSSFEQNISHSEGIDSIKKVVGFGKHVCGSATDMSLVSLLNYDKTSSKQKKVGGICLALCCHSLCSWNTCVAREWLQVTGGITSDEFSVLKKWCGLFVVDSDQLHAQEKRTGHCKDFYARAKVGLMCKRLIDFGRMHFIRTKLNMQIRLVKYVSNATTPENVLLLAYPIHAGIHSSFSN